MIELDKDSLVFRFPEVHADASCRITFQRTLRIPDDNRDHPLPPGLGNFPVDHVDDFADRVPAAWRSHGGVFMPMYQAEALWLNFSSSYPMAVKIAAGKIDAITGEAWRNELTRNPQDYVVLPEQPWLDGFCVEKGLIRQFVAMPLGEGYTAEEQLAGTDEHGGIQLIVYPMKASEYEKLQREMTGMVFGMPEVCMSAPDKTLDMGLAPGGLMRQEIYDDSHGFDVWDTSVRSRCFVHLLNSLQYVTVTGKAPPTRPPSAKDCTDAGLPWFEYYAADQKALEGSGKLASLDSVAAKHIKKGKGTIADNEPVTPVNVTPLRSKGNVVREWEG